MAAVSLVHSYTALHKSVTCLSYWQKNKDILKFQVTDSAYINVLKRVGSSTSRPLVCYICNIYFPIGGVDITISLKVVASSIYVPPY